MSGRGGYAYNCTRIRGDVVLIRAYGDDFWHNNPNRIGFEKELQLHWLSGWGDEEYRGGKPRGDALVLAEWMADGRVHADSIYTHIVDFKDIQTSEDMIALFDMLPFETYKIGIRVGSTEEPKYPVR